MRSLALTDLLAGLERHRRLVVTPQRRVRELERHWHAQSQAPPVPAGEVA